jgi:hypothetical protein
MGAVRPGRVSPAAGTTMADIHILPDHGEAVAYPEERIAELLRTGGVSPGALYWREGMTDWEPIGNYHPPAIPSSRHTEPVPVAAPGMAHNEGPAAIQRTSATAGSNPLAAQAEGHANGSPARPAGSPGRSHYRFRRNPWPTTIILELWLAGCLVIALIELGQGLNDYQRVSTPTLVAPPTLQIAWTEPSGSSKSGGMDLVEEKPADHQDAPITSGELLEWGGWAANLLLLVPYLTWLHRTTVNCRFVSPTMRVSPGMVAGCYFIPFVNLFRPCQDMQEIWRVSGNPRGWFKDRGSILVGLWWVLALVTVGASVESRELFATIRSHDDSVFASLFFVIQKSIQVGWYITFLLLVALILRRQAQAIAKLRRRKTAAAR